MIKYQSNATCHSKGTKILISVSDMGLCKVRMRTADGGEKRDKKIKKEIENNKKKLYDKLIMKNDRK